MLRHLKEKLEQNRHLSYFKRHFVKSEKGRSIIEILGVLAVVAILSILFLVAYAYAMSKHQANQIYKQVDLRAVESFSNPALKNYETGEKYNLVGFKENQGGFNYAHEKGKGNRFYVIVKEVPGRACKRLQEMVREEFPIKREVFLCQGDKGISECTGSLTVTECSEGKRNTFVFAYDTSVSDLFPDPTTPNPDPIVPIDPIDPPSECPEGSYAVGEQCCYPNNITTQVCCENTYNGHDEAGSWVDENGVETDDANGICCAKADTDTKACCKANGGVWAEGTCCAKDDTDTKACCEANNYHWVDEDGVKTDGANGMCCIGLYEWFNDEGICCNKGDQPSGSGNQVFCCHSEFIKNGECCTNDNKTWKTDSKACCEAKDYHWVNEDGVKTDGANGMCCIGLYEWFNDEGICCNKGDQPSGSGNQVFCCHSEFIKNGECCTNDNKTWKTDSKACCEANKHHWVNKVTMVKTDDANGMCCEANGYHWVGEQCCDPSNINTQVCCENAYDGHEKGVWVDKVTMVKTDDANGMCCINSSEYVFTSKDNMCCNLNQNLNQAVNNYCCPKDYETLSEESTIEKKEECCEAAGRNWAFINEENFKCCEKDTEPVIVDSDIVCCPADRKNVINGTCCPSTATGVVDGECCTITKVVQDTDTGEEETICCDKPNLDQRCSFDLDTDIPDNEEDCSALGGIWIGASNQCCTPSLIETNTNACCSKTGGKWSEKEGCTSITTQDGCIEAGGTWIPGENKCCSEEMIYYNTDSCCTKSGYYWDDESQVCLEEASGDYDCTLTVTIPTDLGYCISAINGGISNLKKTTYDDVYNTQKSGYYPACLQYREGYHENNIGVACGKETNVPWYYPAEKECSLDAAGECYREFFFSECPGVGCYCSTNTYFKDPFPQQCVRWGSPSNSFSIRASGEEKAKAQLAAKSKPLKFCYLVKTLAAYFGEDSPTKNSSGLLYIGKWADVNENEDNLKNLTIGTDKEDGESKVTLGDDSDTKCNEGQVCSIASLAKGFIMKNEGKQMKFVGKCVNQTNNY